MSAGAATAARTPRPSRLEAARAKFLGGERRTTRLAYCSRLTSMAIDMDYDTGVRRVTTPEPSGPTPSEGTLRACREIIDAASALALDVEYLARYGDDERKSTAAGDARTSIERIVELAERIRKTPRKRALAGGQER